MALICDFILEFQNSNNYLFGKYLTLWSHSVTPNKEVAANLSCGFFNVSDVVDREHWTWEVSADKWVPVFTYFVFIKMTYSSRYSFIACNSRYA